VRKMRQSYGAALVLGESVGELRISASSPPPSAATLVAGEI
jgi:hypothetical protein